MTWGRTFLMGMSWQLCRAEIFSNRMIVCGCKFRAAITVESEGGHLLLFRGTAKYGKSLISSLV